MSTVVVPSNDPFSTVTPEMVQRADDLELLILQEQGRIQIGYFELGRALSAFKSEGLYLAKSYTKFEDWANSAELQGLGSRTAYNLIRIVDEMLPLIEKYGLMDALPSLSTMYDLLPILNDDNAQEKFIEALKAVYGKTNKDAKLIIKQIRGVEPRGSDNAFFKLVVVSDDGNQYGVRIYCTTPDNYYEMTTSPLKVKRVDWARFEALYKGYVEFQTQ